jgi:alpha-D-ribose 1-methylphosphonate 5-triphosphate synthase subunit PhnG
MTPATDARKRWISVFAKARPSRLEELLADLPSHEMLRAPETGAVMVRGRIGGTGAAFNLGEMTVTRCSVRLSSGEVGHAWVQGRDVSHARRAAVADALMQTKAADRIADEVLRPLNEDLQAARISRARKAAATKVEFFTLVRGEDQ